jgi:hypothetical protein
MRCRVISEADSDVSDKNLSPSSSNAVPTILRFVPTKQQTPLLGEMIAVLCHNHAISITVWAKCKFSLISRGVVHGGNKVL